MTKYRLELINNPHSPFEQTALELDLHLAEKDAKTCATLLGKSLVHGSDSSLDEVDTSRWEPKSFGFVRWFGSMVIILRDTEIKLDENALIEDWEETADES